MKYIKSVAEIRAEHEAKIESIVERNIERLDYKLMHNQITQKEYDHEVMILDKWSSQQIA